MEEDMSTEKTEVGNVARSPGEKVGLWHRKTFSRFQNFILFLNTFRSKKCTPG